MLLYCNLTIVETCHCNKEDYGYTSSHLGWKGWMPNKLKQSTKFQCAQCQCAFESHFLYAAQHHMLWRNRLVSVYLPTAGWHLLPDTQMWHYSLYEWLALLTLWSDVTLLFSVVTGVRMGWMLICVFKSKRSFPLQIGAFGILVKGMIDCAHRCDVTAVGTWVCCCV